MTRLVHGNTSRSEHITVNINRDKVRPCKNLENLIYLLSHGHALVRRMLPRTFYGFSHDRTLSLLTSGICSTTTSMSLAA